MACTLALNDDYEKELENKQIPGHLGMMIPDWLKVVQTTGTTLMAAVYDGGVIIGADTRTSTGSYVANRLADKLTYITDRIYCCRSGSSADTQAVADIVKYQLKFYEMEVGESSSVRIAANLFRDLIYKYRDQLLAGILCAGWDKREKGQIYVIPLGGMLMQAPVAIGGSGSSFIFGYVDSNYKPNMTRQECKDFVLKGVTLAIGRDGSSGGCVRMADISEEGVTRENFKSTDLPKFFDS